jgi:hypothetical protein
VKSSALRVLAVILIAVLSLSVAGSALACPACKEHRPVEGQKGQAPSPSTYAAAFNYSIYFMLSMIYGVPAVLAFAVWRAYRAEQARKRRRRVALGLAMAPAGAPGCATVSKEA